MSAISCEDVLRDLEQYVDGELDATRSLALSDHLRECKNCLEHADFRRKLKRIVRDKWGRDAPEDLMDKVARSIKAHQPSGR
jgi:anti-sigma factor (TIGR02949 family)